MTLRDQCVEAAARVINEWPEIDYPEGGGGLDVAAILDAILDTLEANEDEWDEAALHLATSETPPYSMIGSFLVVLRNPNVEEETRG